jgi:hypothetical protein
VRHEQGLRPGGFGLEESSLPPHSTALVSSSRNACATDSRTSGARSRSAASSFCRHAGIDDCHDV